MAHFFWTMKRLFKKILRRLGLIDNFTLELSISRQTLVDKLSKKVDDYQPDLFDIFTFNKKEYKGFIRTDKFELKRPQSSLITFDHLAEAIGKMKIDNNKLAVSTEIRCIQPYLTLIGFGLTVSIFTSIALFGVASFFASGETDGLYVGLALLIFETIFLGLPLLALRWSVRTLSWDLEQDLRKLRE